LRAGVVVAAVCMEVTSERPARGRDIMVWKPGPPK